MSACGCCRSRPSSRADGWRQDDSARSWAGRAPGTALYALTVLNPPLQMLATEPQTDLMAALLMFGAVMLTLGYEGQSPRTRLRDVGLSLLLPGLAMATRPASITIVAAVVLLWLVAAFGRREFRDSPGWVGVAAFAAAIAPQVLLNWRAYGVASPMAVDSGRTSPASSGACNS